MLDLIYQGEADLAAKFEVMAWPPKVAGKSKFDRDFRDQLEKSPYYKALKASPTHGG
jgi:hypothetical protein